jgi:hypothetical protein
MKEIFIGAGSFISSIYSYSLFLSFSSPASLFEIISFIAVVEIRREGSVCVVEE